MSNQELQADVAVIGLGAIGASVLLQLARRGVRTVGLDRYSVPNAFGSSHGETRITREAVGEGSAYVPLVTNSHRLWAELEAESGERLFRKTGNLIVSPDSGVAETIVEGRSRVDLSPFSLARVRTPQVGSTRRSADPARLTGRAGA